MVSEEVDEDRNIGTVVNTFTSLSMAVKLTLRFELDDHSCRGSEAILVKRFG